MSAHASALALSHLMNALLETAARMDAQKAEQEFEQGLNGLRAEYQFTDEPAMAEAGN